jgi:hypothetical protein
MRLKIVLPFERQNGGTLPHRHSPLRYFR